MVILWYGLQQDQFLQGCLVISVVVTKMVAMSLARGQDTPNAAVPAAKNYLALSVTQQRLRIFKRFEVLSMGETILISGEFCS